MLQDKTYEVKTWNHNDAVIYVTETDVVAVIPVNNNEGVDDDFIVKVNEAAASLAELYQGSPDAEIKIHYTINSHPYVNL